MTGPDELAPEDDALVCDADPSEAVEGAELEVADEETLIPEVIDSRTVEAEVASVPEEVKVDEAKYLLVPY